MHRFPIAPVLVAFISMGLMPMAAPGFFHAWIFSEFYSNADGSVQFIEMVTSFSGETQAAGAQIRTDSGNVFSFPGNLSGNTSNKRLLIATAGFGSLSGGVAPDFTLPATSFFDPTGDRIRLFHPSLNEFHTRTFTSVPTDGVTSLNFPPAGGTPLANTPTNFSGAAGSVNLLPEPSTTGDYNGNGTVDAADYTVWRDTLGQNVTAGDGADGDANGSIGTGDYDFWKSRYGQVVAGSGAGVRVAAVPEPLTASLVIGAVAIACLIVRSR